VIALLLLLAGLVPARPAVGQSTTCKIVFRSNRSGSYGLWIYDQATFTNILDQNAYSPTFSPDALQIGYVLNYDLYVANIDGSAPQSVYSAETVNVNSAAWHDDGKLAYYRHNPGSYSYTPRYYDGTAENLFPSLPGIFATLVSSSAYDTVDCVAGNCVSFSQSISGYERIYYNNNSLWYSTSPDKLNGVLYGNKIYYQQDVDIYRMNVDGSGIELFINDASWIRFDVPSGHYVFQRDNDIYYSDGSATVSRITNDAYVNMQPDIYCYQYTPTPTPTPAPTSITVPMSGTVNIYLGYTLPTATANLTETDTPDYQGAMRSIADGASALFDFSEPPAQLLTTLVLVVILTQVGMFIKAFARWRHGR
jgi:hypothetical protein